MKSKIRSTIAVLRETLGPLTGSESTFAAVTGLSTSWVNKTSYRKIDLTPKAAQRVSSRTGVSVDWLLRGDISIPPIEIDNRTPYNRSSYDRYVEKTSLVTPEAPEVGAAQSTAAILSSFFAGIKAGKGKSARNDLWEFSRLMEGKYGSGENEWPGILVIVDEIQKLSQWSRSQPASPVDKHALPTRANPMDKLRISFEDQEKKRTRQKPKIAPLAAADFPEDS